MFHGMTFAELGWGRALLVALSGYVVVFLMMLGILSAADFVCCSRNPSQKRKAVQTHNSEEIYEAP